MINSLNGTDMAGYIDWALSISAGDWVGKHVYYQAPLFPYTLAAVFTILGESIFIAGLIQAILGALTCVLVYGLAREVFGIQIARIASLISCFYGPFIFYTAILLSATLAIFLISLALFSLIISLRQKSKTLLILSGFLLGLACLARPNFLLLAVFILLSFLLRRGRLAKVASSLMFCAGLAVAILPVTARNYIVSRRVVIISGNAFETFRLANSYDSLALNFVYPERPIMPAYSGAFWKHQLRKGILFWCGYEVPQNVNYYLFMKHSKTLRAPLFPFWIIAPLGLMGIAISLATRRDNSVLYLFTSSHYVSIVIFYIISRLRLPIMIGLIPFAALSLFSFHEQLKFKHYRKFFFRFAVLLILICLIMPWHTDKIRPTDYSMLARAMIRKGMYSDAAEQLRKCLQLDPRSDNHETLRSLIEKLEKADGSSDDQ